MDFSRIRGGSDGLFFAKQFQGLHHGCLLFGRETRRRDFSLAGFDFLGSLVGFFHVPASCSDDDDDDDDGFSHHFLWKIHMFVLPKQSGKPPQCFEKASLAAQDLWDDDFRTAGEAVLLHELVSSIASGRCLRVSKGGGGNLFLNLSLPTFPQVERMEPKVWWSFEKFGKTSYALKGDIFFS